MELYLMLYYRRIVMSEIILQINDDIEFDKVISLLSPYIAKAEVNHISKKRWNLLHL
jgi:hypothetical protein